MKTTYEKLVHWLKEKKISPDEALEILDRTLQTNPTSVRSRWKMVRFSLYLSARYLEGVLEIRTVQRKGTVERLCKSTQYRKEFEKYNQGKRFDLKKQIDNLYYLITDPRQFDYFRAENFKFPKGLFKGAKTTLTAEEIKILR